MTNLSFSPNSAFNSLVSPQDSCVENQEKRGNKSSPLLLLTLNITSTYKRCNIEFKPVNKLPRRILTQPSDGVLNDGLDNEDSNLICRVHDILESPSAKYIILDLLGTGTFGQVFRCQKDGTKEVVAIKIIKNKPAYHAQGLLEAKIARLLNQKYDARDECHIVRLQECFEFKGHICLIFELLSMSLLDILTQNQFRGLPLHVVQRFTRQILAALVTFQDAEVIHCDLKPENVLLSPSKQPPVSQIQNRMPRNSTSDESSKIESTRSSFHQLSTSSSSSSNNPFLNGMGGEKTFLPSVPESASLSSSGITTIASESTNTTQTNRTAMWSDVKVIDLGSACFEGQTMYSYIQSRFCKF
jgi:serine/threonine protein kinase